MEDDNKLQLCLTWNSYTDNIVNSLMTSYGDQDFVDVTLACEGESIKAHKLVLSACSLYLKKLLKENPCPHPIIILRGVGVAELKDLLVYMYNGEVRVEQERIAKLLHTAELLEIRGLRDITGTGYDTVDETSESGHLEELNHIANIKPNKPAIISTKKNRTLRCNSESTPPPAKKCRPVPRLQHIQVYNKADMPHEASREESSSSATSLFAPEHGFVLEDVHDTIKEEAEEMLDTFNSTDLDYREVDETSSEEEMRNGYNSSTPTMEDSPGGLFAVQMLQRVATRANRGDCAIEAAIDNTVVMPSTPDTDVVGSGGKRKLAFHEPRPCPLCQRVYRDAATLRTHVAIMHTAGLQPFACTCGALFLTKFHMYTHKKNGHK